MIDDPAINKPLVGVALGVALAVFGGWYYWHRHHVVPPQAPLVAAPAAPAPPTEEAIKHPMPLTVEPAKAPLPALGESDTAFNTALDEAAGSPALSQYLVPESIIRHLVVTVDNLPRQKVAVEKRPLTSMRGALMADGDELHATLDPQNFQRYEPLVGALQQIDMQRLASVYMRFYPLFQKAYQDLGYPNGYFNDRVVQVIDVLLATPLIEGPIDLVRPNVMYRFADPTLESRPAGQKLLIRMGPANAKAVKAKLTELRAIITAVSPNR